MPEDAATRTENRRSTRLIIWNRRLHSAAVSIKSQIPRAALPMPGVYSFSLFLCRQRLQFPDTRRLPVNHLLLLIHFCRCSSISCCCSFIFCRCSSISCFYICIIDYLLFFIYIPRPAAQKKRPPLRWEWTQKLPGPETGESLFQSLKSILPADQPGIDSFIFVAGRIPGEVFLHSSCDHLVPLFAVHEIGVFRVIDHFHHVPGIVISEGEAVSGAFELVVRLYRILQAPVSRTMGTVP